MFKELVGKDIKVVYYEAEKSDRPFAVFGELIEVDEDFICMKTRGSVHYLALKNIVRVSER